MGSGASTTSSKVVVVVGGGYAGISVAQALDCHFQVKVIEARDGLNHAMGGLRASVDEDFANKCVIPLDGALRRGQVVKDKVMSWEAEKKCVKLASGQEVPYDYLVFAIGLSPIILVSIAQGGLYVITLLDHNMWDGGRPHNLFLLTNQYVLQGRAEGQSREEMLQSYANTRNAIRAAENILILGGGHVGVELAGEILAYFPKKHITLVHAGVSRNHSHILSPIHLQILPPSVFSSACGPCLPPPIIYMIYSPNSVPSRWGQHPRDLPRKCSGS